MSPVCPSPPTSQMRQEVMFLSVRKKLYSMQGQIILVGGCEKPNEDECTVHQLGHVVACFTG
jgi:hypothetical protein